MSSKVMMLEAEHHVEYICDEAAIAVIGEAAVAGRASASAFDRLVVEAEIEHGVHHARHRGARAGAHRDQQRIAWNRRNALPVSLPTWSSAFSTCAFNSFG
jgi:UDP:flavonoid glycosyltransferase YjiC (YdhE family)